MERAGNRDEYGEIAEYYDHVVPYRDRQDVDFFVDEAAVIWGFFRGLIPDAIVFLEQRGVPRDELTELNRSILAMLDLPDGRPFVSRKRWAEKSCAGRCRARRSRSRCLSPRDAASG